MLINKESEQSLALSRVLANRWGEGGDVLCWGTEGVVEVRGYGDSVLRSWSQILQDEHQTTCIALKNMMKREINWRYSDTSDE